MAELKTQGVSLYLLDSTDSGNEVREIGKVTGISGVGGEAGEIEITNFDSTGKEYLVGLEDSGTVSVSLNYDPASSSNHATLIGLQGGSNKRFLIAGSEASTDPTYTSTYTIPTDRTTWDFTAGVKSFNFDMSPDDAVRSSMSLRVSGAITITAAV
jgi:hypothetical protein